MNEEIEKKLEELILKALEEQDRLKETERLMDLWLTVARIKSFEK